MANPTTVFGLPAPLLSGQADGPDALQDLNDKLEITLGALARVFTHSLGALVWGNGFVSFNLTSVPLGRPVFINWSATARLPAFQYLIVEVFDGITQVGTDVTVAAPGGQAATLPFAVSYARSFTATPELRLFLGGSGTTTIDASTWFGIGFNWPS